MNYLLDTCFVSEMVKPRPEPSVMAWLGDQQIERLFLSVLTLGELVKGISRLEEGRKRRGLESWLQRELKPRFMGRWLAVDEEIAERWGALRSDAARRGKPLPAVDGLLAATALARNLTIVTRNVADMRVSGAPILNPWLAG